LAYKDYNQGKHSLAIYFFKTDYLFNYLKRYNNKPSLCYKKDLKQAFKIQNCFKAKL
jgi:hypothetical protein